MLVNTKPPGSRPLTRMRTAYRDAVQHATSAGNCQIEQYGIDGPLTIVPVIIRSMRRFLLLTTLAVVLFTGSARAEIQIIGGGIDSCGTWTADRRTRTIWVQDGQWVLGFLSGIAYAMNAQDYDPLETMDAQDVWAWLDNYCQTHPLEHIGRAAATFVAAHPRR